ncbi:MAG: hypothetical protein GY757_41100, partial [bacterium]|nr:hypothetical protein [bacterium]
MKNKTKKEKAINILLQFGIFLFTIGTIYPVLWVIKIAFGSSKGLSISLSL